MIDSCRLILYKISKLAKKEIKSPIQLHLRGGQRGSSEGTSEGTIEAIKIWMNTRKDLPMEIASDECFQKDSLSIDSRTGQVSEYDPMTNPKRRVISDLDAAFALSFSLSGQIRVIYNPKI